MQSKKKKRLALIIVGAVIMVLAIILIRDGLMEEASLFQSPTEIKSNISDKDENQNIRLGGYVYEGSLKILEDGTYRFLITDYSNDIEVYYKGILPDLFREGQGVYIDGFIKGGIFQAKTVLAKHDENYNPPIPGEGI